MPEASPELRAKMKDFYGDSIDTSGPQRYLEEQGYVLQPDWFWLPKAGVTKYEDMEEQEWLSLKFLIDEWDYGGLALGGTQ